MVSAAECEGTSERGRAQEEVTTHVGLQEVSLAYLIERPETQAAVLKADTCLQENRPRDALMPLALAFARETNARRLDHHLHFGFGLGLNGEDAENIQRDQQAGERDGAARRGSNSCGTASHDGARAVLNGVDPYRAVRNDASAHGPLALGSLRLGLALFTGLEIARPPTRPAGTVSGSGRSCVPRCSTPSFTANGRLSWSLGRPQ